MAKRPKRFRMGIAALSFEHGPRILATYLDHCREKKAEPTDTNRWWQWFDKWADENGADYYDIEAQAICQYCMASLHMTKRAKAPRVWLTEGGKVSHSRPIIQPERQYAE